MLQGSPTALAAVRAYLDAERGGDWETNPVNLERSS